MTHPAAPAPGSPSDAASNGAGAPEEPDSRETVVGDGEGAGARSGEDIARPPEVPLDLPDLSEDELPTGRPGPYVDRSTDVPIDLDEETAAPRVAPPRRGIVTFLVVVVTMIAAFVTGLYVFNNMVMPRLIHRSGEVKVPDLSNLNYEQAEQALKPLGLVLSRAGERFDPSVPRGFILTQDPPSETPVRGRKRVMVVVSLGEEFSSVPSLFGESLRSARFLLQRSGLRVSGITRAPSDEVGDGLVAGTDPPAEAVLPRNATVALLVSTGTGKEQYVMPELLGRELQGVRRHLESLGFRVVTPPAAPTVGAIVFQDPAPGSRIDLDTPINLQAMGRVIR
jgi:beta-lactam-binding protein with PASTA domain